MAAYICWRSVGTMLLQWARIGLFVYVFIYLPNHLLCSGFVYVLIYLPIYLIIVLTGRTCWRERRRSDRTGSHQRQNRRTAAERRSPRVRVKGRRRRRRKHQGSNPQLQRRRRAVGARRSRSARDYILPRRGRRRRTRSNLLLQLPLRGQSPL